MANEGFEADEWDADFLDKLVQAEEQALSATQIPLYLPPPRPPPSWDVSYSPPRELSQRTHQVSDAGGNLDLFDSFASRGARFTKEHEVDRLKKELSRVSKQLNLKEQECSDLRKEKDKMVEELHARIEVKNTEPHHTNNEELISRACQNANASNKLLDSWTTSCDIVGALADKTTDPRIEKTNTLQGSEKLLDLWNSSGQKLGKMLVAKLLVTCEADFHVLFGYLNGSNNALSDELHSIQSIEAAKISQLYSVLMKFNDETLRLEDLLESLVDLCSLKKVDIIHRTLHILHMVLCNSSNMEQRIGERENVVIEDPVSKTSNSKLNGGGYLGKKDQVFANLSEMFNQANIPCGLKFSTDKPPLGSVGLFRSSFEASISGVYWASLFQHMSQLAMMYKGDQIRCEALSIMKLILLRSNAYTERDKFTREIVFQSLSQLLRREAGFFVQSQAVDIIYLLFNCPKFMALFCSDCKEDGEHSCIEPVDEKGIANSQGLREILNGLVDCLASSGGVSAQEMKLRRNAIVFLAFLGSSGKSGLEILINYRPPKSSNFLSIILQSLVSDLDQGALDSAQPCNIFREWILLIREALIFFNRLVSHPQYSVHVLQSLTETRDIASMTVVVANRLTNKAKLFWQLDDKLTKQIRECEIVELAYVFKRRVYFYLGENIS
ncbi:protein SENSITIVE TO UV 2 [Primulina eburnea]|uniref:protein SENSITIVE TO UV 2 n=1 Tax=Primulina eburnea TaxID=1245227 RepID=UPI003C6BFDC1